MWFAQIYDPSSSPDRPKKMILFLIKYSSAGELGATTRPTLLQNFIAKKFIVQAGRKPTLNQNTFERQEPLGGDRAERGFRQEIFTTCSMHMKFKAKKAQC
jgi:hypothetical protein